MPRQNHRRTMYPEANRDGTQAVPYAGLRNYTFFRTILDDSVGDGLCAVPL